jgi:thiamine biosynthesis protein ThiI
MSRAIVLDALPPEDLIKLQATAVLFRYSEIAIKGNNRSYFEKQLVRNARRVLRQIPELICHRERGRILLHLPKFAPFTEADLLLIIERLPWVFGLVSYSIGCRMASDMEAIENAISTAVTRRYELLSPHRETITYRLRARRSGKQFPRNSKEMEIHFAELLFPRFPKLRLNLDHAELTILLEIREHWSFIFFDQRPGPGGLPVGTNGRAISLISGGIDSPVASYLTMRRGCSLHYVTFHSHPYTTPESIQKVARLVQVLNRHQKPGRLFACNMVVAQKAIRDNCRERYRTIMYRRIMMRVAQTLAGQMHVTALATGDCIGQVASQTLDNMGVINEASDLLVLRPLLGMDKQEIVDIGRRIDTFPISEVACADSCTVFAPQRPSTGAKLDEVIADELNIDVPALVEACLKATMLVNLETFEQRAWLDPDEHSERADSPEGGGQDCAE